MSAGVLAWERIRVLRAQPPPRVEGERAKVFVSALEQAEQLMRAADDVGPAASPLLLFYALSQAGRAIAAARLDDVWRLSGHGLKAPTPADPSTGLLGRVVKPDRREGATSRQPAFAGIAKATGSAPLTGAVELGAVWAAIPDLMPPLPQPQLDGEGWIRPLRVFPPAFDAAHMRLANMRPLELLVDGLPDGDLDTLLTCLSAYPTAAGVYMGHTLGMRDDVLITQPGSTGMLPVFCWPDIPTDLRARAVHLDAIAPDYRGLGTRMLFPLVGGKDALSPLMLWWILLFGLSSVARYDPELWVGVLDVNSSPLAVPIEAALGTAIQVLPELIFAGLTE